MLAAYNSLGRPSKPVSQIPFSVYSLIVNECASYQHLQDRNPSLQNLSLAQKFLKELCQRQLFKNVCYGKRNIERLTFLYEVSPHLITYIQDFDYTFSGNDGIVLKFIQNLGHVNGFSFRGVDAESESPVTDFLRDVDPQLAMAILEIIHSPNLRSLCLHRVDNYPVQYLLQLGFMPNLRNLSIQEVQTDSIITPTLNIQGSYAPSAPLSYIHTGPRSGQTLSMLVGGFWSPEGFHHNFNFHSVRELYAEVEEQADVDGIKYLIQSCKGLEKLTCEMYTFGNADTATFEGFAGSILSGPYQTLRSLQFFARIDYSSERFGHLDFSRIKEQVQQLNDSHRLNAFETLIISLDIADVGPTVAEAKRIYGDIGTWLKEMDVILGRVPGFPLLQQVSITVYATVECPMSMDYDEKRGAKLDKIYDNMAKKLRNECFEYLSGLDLNVEYEMEWDLPDWDLMYRTG